MSLIVAFVPIWLLVAAGYAARRLPVRGRRLLGDRLLSALSWFVFHVAMPAALFVTLAKTPLTGFDARPLIAFAISTGPGTPRPGEAASARAISSGVSSSGGFRREPATR